MIRREPWAARTSAGATTLGEVGEAVAPLDGGVGVAVPNVDPPLGVGVAIGLLGVAVGVAVGVGVGVGDDVGAGALVPANATPSMMTAAPAGEVGCSRIRTFALYAPRGALTGPVVTSPPATTIAREPSPITNPESSVWI